MSAAPTTIRLEVLWQAVRSGLITWPSARRYEAQQAPQCPEHHCPAWASDGTRYVCIVCVADRLGKGVTR